MDLIEPSRIRSGNCYAFIIINDYSRYTQTLFLANKSDTFQAFTKLAKLIQNKKYSTIVSLKSDLGGEFNNHDFTNYYDKNGISYNFYAPKTPKQNRVVERKIIC